MPPSPTVTPSAGQAPDQIDKVFARFQAGLCDQILATGTNPHGGLAIATTNTKVKTSYAIYGVLSGAIFTKAATDNLWTLAGSVTNAKFNIFALMLDASGTATVAMGTEAATLAAVVFPTIPPGQLVVGFLVINPTGTGPFVGGTTPLGDATVVPNAAYVNTPGEFNPNLLTI